VKLLREESRGGQKQLTAIYTLCMNISLFQWLVAWISRQTAGLLLTRQHRGLCLLQLWSVHLMENYMQRVPEADVQTFRTWQMYSASRVTFFEMQRDLDVSQQSAFYRKSPSNDTQLDTLP